MPATDDSFVVRLAVGESWTADLPGLGSAGYRWSEAVEGDAGVVSIGWSLVRPSTDGPATVGRSALERLLVTGIAPGRVLVRLSQQRPWESAPPRAQRTVEVEVGAPRD